MTTMDLAEREGMISEIGQALNTLLDNPGIKRLDGDGWKAYRVGQQIRVDVNHSTKEKQ